MKLFEPKDLPPIVLTYSKFSEDRVAFFRLAGPHQVVLVIDDNDGRTLMAAGGTFAADEVDFDIDLQQRWSWMPRWMRKMLWLLSD